MSLDNKENEVNLSVKIPHSSEPVSDPFTMKMRDAHAEDLINPTPDALDTQGNPVHFTNTTKTEYIPELDDLFVKGGETKKTWSKKRKTYTGIGGLGVGLALVGSIIGASIAGASNSNNTPETSPVATASAPSTLETTPWSSPANTSEHSATMPEVLKQITSVEAMDSMSIQDFAKLSFADRYAYAVAKSDLSVLQPATLNNDPGETDKNAITGFDWYNLMGQAWMHSGTETGAKIDSALYYFTTDNTGKPDVRYQSDIDTITQASPDANLTTRYNYIKSGDQMNGIDSLGNPIDYTNITVDVVDYYLDGTQHKQKTQTIQVIKSNIETLDGNSYIAYSMGYSVDGDGSPEPTQ